MSSPTNRGRWLALTAALLGWMFDGMEMGLFPLVGKDALKDLLANRASDQNTVDTWYGVIIAGFLVGAATGGVLFGWLGDTIGRVRAMTISVLLYSLASGLSAFSQEAWHLAVCRFIGALGMGGEWALGVALVMELWADKSRAWLAGWIGAFGNLGYTLVGSIALLLTQIKLSESLASFGIGADTTRWLTSNNNWRLLMLVGAVPSLLTFVIRIFVPESDRWEAGAAAGKTSHWSRRDLLGVLVAAIAGAGMISLSVIDIRNDVRLLGTAVGFVVVVFGFLHPVRGYVSRAGMLPQQQRQTIGRMLLAAGLSGVALLGTWAGLMWMYMWVSKLPGGDIPQAKPTMQILSSLGAALGCVLGAVFGGLFGRRPVYAVLCVASAAMVVAFYRGNTHYDTLFLGSTFAMGLITAAFYGWLPLYLPELFPTAVRATGQGFGFNCGRVIAAIGSLQMPNVLAAFGNDYGQACGLVAGVYVLGLVLIAFAPETKGKPLPE